MFLDMMLVGGSTGSFSPTVTPYSTAGTFTVTIPFGASTMDIQLGGPGGGGAGSIFNSTFGNGAGSGALCESSYSVSGAGGQTVTLTVGSAGIGGAINTAGGTGTASTCVSGSFTITAMSAGPGVGGEQGSNTPGGTASGGTLTNTTGNSVTNGVQAGGASLSGTNGSTISNGGQGGGTVGGVGHAGSTAQVPTCYVAFS